MNKKKSLNIFSSSEELVSMFLGLAVVFVIAGLVFNFFQKHKGDVTIPGSEVNANDNNKENIYEVKRGDHLWKIATEKYNDGYKWVLIAKENNLTNPGSIEVGQKLVIPEIENITLDQEKSKLDNSENKITMETEYTVLKGDNLWNICVENYGDGYKWTKVWQENKAVLPNASGLEIGMKLKLPVIN